MALDTRLEPYVPRPVPRDPQLLPAYLTEEFRRIAQAVEASITASKELDAEKLSGGTTWSTV
jgi:hypothetical protein